MVETIMPCLIDPSGNPREEGIIIGRLLAGYGELELEMCQCMSATGKMDIDEAIRQVFGERGGENRIDAAKKAMRESYISAGFGNEYAETIADLQHCRKIRNQFAHCHFYAWSGAGLQFVNLEYVAREVGPVRKFANASEIVSIQTIRDQEAFFKYVQRCFWSLAGAYRVKAAMDADELPGVIASIHQDLQKRFNRSCTIKFGNPRSAAGIRDQ